MAFYTIARAAFGYLFLVLLVRIVGRRPGKQLTPFEFVLIFYIGGLMLTGIVGPEMSLTNAFCQIVTIGLCHVVLSWLRYRSLRLARILDGIPLILLEGGHWRSESMKRMRIQDDDVMDAARAQGIRDLGGIEVAVLETAGSITIVGHGPGSAADAKPDMQDGH